MNYLNRLIRLKMIYNFFVFQSVLFKNCNFKRLLTKNSEQQFFYLTVRTAYEEFCIKFSSFTEKIKLNQHFRKN